MLTALSVARECGFVGETERIILVQAFPQQTDQYGNISEPAHLEYMYTDPEPTQKSKQKSLTDKGSLLVSNIFTSIDENSKIWINV